MRADELRVGDRLRQLDGSLTTVASVHERPGTHDVFNLEIQVDHVYHVGSGGVLVHNGDPCPKHVLLGQDMPNRVNPTAHRHNWRTLKEQGWTWKKNVEFLRYAARQVTAGKARIFDIGFKPNGYRGPKSIFVKEMKYLKAQGLKRVDTGRTVRDANGVRHKLWEWVPE